MKTYIKLFAITFISLILIISFIVSDFHWLIKNSGFCNFGRFFVMVISLCLPLAYEQCNEKKK